MRSFIISPGFSKPVETMEDMTKSGYPIKVAWYKMYDSMWTSSSDATVKVWIQINSKYKAKKILHIPLQEFVRKKTNVDINMFPYEDVSKHNVKLLKLESSLLR